MVADAREALTALTAALDGYAVDDGYRAEQAELWRDGTPARRRRTTLPPR